MSTWLELVIDRTGWHCLLWKPRDSAVLRYDFEFKSVWLSVLIAKNVGPLSFTRWALSHSHTCHQSCHLLRDTTGPKVMKTYITIDKRRVL